MQCSRWNGSHVIDLSNVLHVGDLNGGPEPIGTVTCSEPYFLMTILTLGRCLASVTFDLRLDLESDDHSEPKSLFKILKMSF